jgi:hypothetical protein
LPSHSSTNLVYQFTIEKITFVQLIDFENIVLLIAKTLVLQLGSAVGRNLGVGK